MQCIYCSVINLNGTIGTYTITYYLYTYISVIKIIITKYYIINFIVYTIIT